MSDSPATSKHSQLAGTLWAVGGFLVGISGFFVWARFSISGSNITIGRTLFQYGPHNSFALSELFVPIFGCVFIYEAAVCFNRVQPFRRYGQFSLALPVVTIFIIWNRWPGSWSLPAGVSVSRGPGGAVAVAGCVAGLIAAVLRASEHRNRTKEVDTGSDVTSSKADTALPTSSSSTTDPSITESTVGDGGEDSNGAAEAT